MARMVTRKMVVADGGVSRQFVPGPLPSGVSAQTIRRLERAGALAHPRGPAPELESPEDSSPGGGPDLEAMTKAALIDLAAKRNISVNPRDTKAAIIDAIRAAPAA